MIKNRLLHHHRLDNRGPTLGKRFLKLKMQTVTHPLFPYNGDLSISHVARCAGVLFVRANVISSRLFIRPIMFDLELELTVGVVGGEGRKGIFTFPALTLSLFLTIDCPTLQISFSPQPSDAIKIKEGGYNFHQESTEHSLAKITPALQAI